MRAREEEEKLMCADRLRNVEPKCRLGAADPWWRSPRSGRGSSALTLWNEAYHTTCTNPAWGGSIGPWGKPIDALRPRCIRSLLELSSALESAV